MNIFCEVRITGNQGVDVCCADRQRVPLIVSTNSIFVVGSSGNDAARSGKMFSRLSKLSTLSFQCLSATYPRATCAFNSRSGWISLVVSFFFINFFFFSFKVIRNDSDPKRTP